MSSAQALTQAVNLHHWAPYYVFRWLGYWTGISNESGKGYGFWSGIGSCLAYIGVPLAVYRKHNCHKTWCWRMWHHEIADAEGHIIKVCHRHHPSRPKKITAAHISAAWTHHRSRHSGDAVGARRDADSGATHRSPGASGLAGASPGGDTISPAA